jgi:hypothetical protein
LNVALAYVEFKSKVTSAKYTILSKTSLRLGAKQMLCENEINYFF